MTAMSAYVAAYDVESPGCLDACRTIVDVHRRYDMPATFFITGVTLEADADEYRRLLDDPLFEVASHTYSHRLLLDHPLCGEAPPADQVAEEILRSKAVVEDVFQRPCAGLRPAVGFLDGLAGAADVLARVAEAGYRYVSSKAWGPDYSMPALLAEPFAYADDGFSDLWELPCHGWHENLLKDHNRWGPRRLTLWPSAMPEAIPPDFVKTPEDEFAVHRVFLDQAVRREATHVSLIWHPWSLAQFDPPMRMLELVFDHVRQSPLQPATFADLRERLG